MVFAQKTQGEEQRVAASVADWYNSKVSDFSRRNPDSKLQPISAQQIAVRQIAPALYEVDIKGRGSAKGPDMLVELTGKGPVPLINYDQHISLFGFAEEGWKKMVPTKRA
ncbi:MAG: hypothetical protein WC759_00655 [Candidatus Micrarchaeia archaeon]|jgi:hypothetical protein